MKQRAIFLQLVLIVGGYLLLLPGSAEVRAIDNSISEERELTITLVGNLQNNSPQSIAVSDLEQLPQVEYTVTDPYADQRIVCTGVLLRELVNRYGQPNTQQVLLRAIDEYKVSFLRNEWEKWDLMLATRANGKHMTLREKGPVKIVMPYETAKDINHTIYTPKWIWQISSIEFLKGGPK